MTVYDLKPRFQALLRPITRAMAARGITANQVTLAAVALSVVAGGLLALYPTHALALLLIPLILLLRMALNAIDGMLAREHGQQSRLGAILNELGDVVSDIALYLPFALIPGVSATLVVLLVLAAAVVEMTGVVAVQIGASRRYDGPLGKSDRAVLFGGLALLFGLGLSAGDWTTIVLAIALAMSLLTVVKRARNALREVDAHAA
ncbi:MAG: CDP-alcohol phosphatidyltransferase family protein [Gammaproteobacteria bacterium]|nr:CDP-alcohol phosphatidyltransferase family protein [Gammaproteobacteria bacterium]